jgi:hypothetical protein
MQRSRRGGSECQGIEMQNEKVVAQTGQSERRTCDKTSRVFHFVVCSEAKNVLRPKKSGERRTGVSPLVFLPPLWVVLCSFSTSRRSTSMNRDLTPNTSSAESTCRKIMPFTARLRRASGHYPLQVVRPYVPASGRRHRLRRRQEHPSVPLPARVFDPPALISGPRVVPLIIVAFL